MSHAWCGAAIDRSNRGAALDLPAGPNSLEHKGSSLMTLLRIIVKRFCAECLDLLPDPQRNAFFN